MLKQRVLAALVLIPVFLAALLYLPHWAWALFMGAVTAGASWEWARLAGYSAVSRALYAALVWIFLGYLYVGENTAVSSVILAAALVFWLMIAPLWLAKHWVIRHRLNLALTGLMVLLPTWLAFVRLRESSALLLLFIMSLVWIADSAAYFAGRRWGKHKLAPLISPGKTWEGVVGALLAAQLYVVLWKWFAPDALPYLASVSMMWLILAASLLVAISIVGDLFESHMKRCAGMKDSGHLIPGHGGILDRIDSQTSVLPVALALMVFSGLSI